MGNKIRIVELENKEFAIQKKIIFFWRFYEIRTLRYGGMVEYIKTFTTAEEAREYIVENFFTKKRKWNRVITVVLEGRRKEDFQNIKKQNL